MKKPCCNLSAARDVEPVAHGAPAKLYEYDPEAEKANFISVLKEDLLFRRYMIAQFHSGHVEYLGAHRFLYIALKK